MIDLRVIGDGRARDVAKRLELAANGKLRHDISQAVVEAVRPVPASIRRNILIKMPHRGGFARTLAGADFVVKPITWGGMAGARLLVLSPMDEARIDQGRLRHPRFGDREHWYSQTVPKRVFSGPVHDAGSDVRAAIVDVVNRDLGGR